MSKQVFSGGQSFSAGFTLIEVMIVVAIIAIIAAIALPSYQEHIAKARRSEAMSALLEGAQALERYYSANGRYVTANNGNTLAAVFPTQVPAAGTAYYTIAATGTPDNSSFTLRATRAGSMADDDCGSFELNQAGVRALNGNTSGVTVEQCWRR